MTGGDAVKRIQICARRYEPCPKISSEALQLRGRCGGYSRSFKRVRRASILPGHFPGDREKFGPRIDERKLLGQLDGLGTVGWIVEDGANGIA